MCVDVEYLENHFNPKHIEELENLMRFQSGLNVFFLLIVLFSRGKVLNRTNVFRLMRKVRNELLVWAGNNGEIIRTDPFFLYLRNLFTWS